MNKTNETITELKDMRNKLEGAKETQGECLNFEKFHLYIFAMLFPNSITMSERFSILECKKHVKSCDKCSKMIDDALDQVEIIANQSVGEFNIDAFAVAMDEVYAESNSEVVESESSKGTR